MSSTAVPSQYPMFFNVDGSTLNNGSIYIGKKNTNPKIAENQIPVYWDPEFIQPAPQPLKTSGGAIYRSGSPANIYIKEDYSLSIYTNSSQLVAYFPVGAKILSSSNGSASIGFIQSGIGSVQRNLQDKSRERISPEDFGASGNGLTDDSAAFATLELNYTGRVIDLNGRSYSVSSYPTGNSYVNGRFIISSVAYQVQSAQAVISDLSDTGGLDTPYSGGVLNLISFSGRTTANTLAVMASQNCRSQGVRAVNFGSIYSLANGNVSGNYSARQSYALVPQSANLASEECWSWGGFRGLNASSAFSGCENESNANVACRYSVASGRASGNFASTFSYAGRGGGARFAVTLTGDAVTGLSVLRAGEKYLVGDAIIFNARESAGTGATASVASVGALGEILTVTVLTGGSGYSGRVDATVDNGTGDYSANVGSSGCETWGLASVTAGSLNSKATGGQSAIVGSSGSTASGDVSGVFASTASTASGGNSAVVASTGSIVSGGYAAAIASNNSTATADGALVIGRRVTNSVARSIAFGDSASGGPSTANRKMHMMPNGALQIAGTLTQNQVFTDIAKMFENAVPEPIPVGALVAFEGRKVRLAVPGDIEVSAHSRTYAMLLGDSQFTWSGRYLTDEFGEFIEHEIPDPDWQPEIPDPGWPRDIPNPNHPVFERVEIEGAAKELVVSTPTIPNPDQAPLVPNPTPQPMVRVRIESPDFDIDQPQVPRSERRDEWTPVALLGEVHVRVDSSVGIDDYITPVAPGLGGKSANQTGIRCMEIRKGFDATKGYAVALCLVH